MAQLGRLRFRVTHDPATALGVYGRSKLAGVAGIMQASETRLFEDVKAHTPVDTGHMQEHLLRTSDIVPVETNYQVFWRRQEFVGEVNPRGEIISEFYPATLILGGPEKAPKYPALMTAEAEAERPRLTRELAQHFARR